MTICEMNPGDNAIITGYKSSSNKFVKRLLELGFTRGAEVKVVKTSPFPELNIVELRGSRLVIGDEESSAIRVQKLLF